MTLPGWSSEVLIVAVPALAALCGVLWTQRGQNRATREVALFKRLERVEDRMDRIETELSRTRKRLAVSLAYIERLISLAANHGLVVPPPPTVLKNLLAALSAEAEDEEEL